jgi:hypothetical protein
MPFHEDCAEMATPLPNSEVKWSCINDDEYRGYRSFEQLYASLRRNREAHWELIRDTDRDPALLKAHGRLMLWNCGPVTCGVWIKYEENQLIFLQSMRNYTHVPFWLGVGITTFCEADTDTCLKLKQTAHDLIPSVIELNDSVVGDQPYRVAVPPPLPPPPPGYVTPTPPPRPANDEEKH